MNKLTRARLNKLLDSKEYHNNLAIYYLVKTINDPSNKLTDESLNTLLDVADQILYLREELYRQIRTNANLTINVKPTEPITLDSH